MVQIRARTGLLLEDPLPRVVTYHVFVTYFPPFPSLFSRFLSMNCEHWDTVTSGLPYAKNSLSQTEGMKLGAIKRPVSYFLRFAGRAFLIPGAVRWFEWYIGSLYRLPRDRLGMPLRLY